MLLIGFIAGWYVTVRLASPFTVVKIVHVEPNTESAIVDPQQPFDTLRVGCFNIAHGRGPILRTANWNGGSGKEKLTRLIQIAQLLRDARLDIVVLNEVDFDCFWSGGIDQAKTIARHAGYPYSVQQKNMDLAIPGLSVRCGNAILSRYPIDQAVLLDYPNPSWFQDIFVGSIKDGTIAAITLPDQSRLNVAAVHLSLDGETVRTASVKMIQAFGKTSDTPLIVMGDFNSTPSGYPDHKTNAAGENCIYMLLADDQFQTLPKGLPPSPNELTFPSEKPVRLIDWIFVSTEWQIVEKTVIQTNLSDHLPVTMTLKKYRN